MKALLSFLQSHPLRVANSFVDKLDMPISANSIGHAYLIFKYSALSDIDNCNVNYMQYGRNLLE